MRVAVVYGSRTGNTRAVAEAIAASLGSLGTVDLMRVETAEIAPGTELLVVGGPTEGHGMTPEVKSFLDGLGRVEGIRAAAFDTKLRWPLWLSGSAAGQIAERLEAAGATLVASPESFLVTTREPQLYEGELERASRWAESLLAVLALAHA